MLKDNINEKLIYINSNHIVKNWEGNYIKKFMVDQKILALLVNIQK